MEITKTQIDELNIELTLQVQNADYAEIEKKKLAERRRTAEFKGFRKGMVPASMIKKVYGDQCLVDSVNDVVSKALDEYISESGLHLLGEPITGKNQPEIEWVDGNDFTFLFDCGLSPEVNFEVEKGDTVQLYNVTISAKDKEPVLENLKKYYEGKEEAKSDEDLDKEVTERLEAEFKQEADWRLTKDIKDFYIQKAGVKLPEDFLKRWLYVANNGKVTKEDIEKEFTGFAEDFKWQLVRGFLLKKFEFNLDENDLMEAAASYVRYQYAMYGMNDVPEDMISEAVKNILQDQKQVDRLAEQVEDSKVIGKLKEEMTIKSKKISAEKFREL